MFCCFLFVVAIPEELHKHCKIMKQLVSVYFTIVEISEVDGTIYEEMELNMDLSQVSNIKLSLIGTNGCRCVGLVWVCVLS